MAKQERWFTAKCPPNESGRYWCYVSRHNDLALSYFQWNCSYSQEDNRWCVDKLEDLGAIVTHWMPLEEIPQAEHKCKYCGCMTTQSDRECWNHPINRIKLFPIVIWHRFKIAITGEAETNE